MLSTLIHTALFVALGARHVAAANLQIDTPTLTQCQTATLSYSGGQGGYGLYVVPSEDSCADSVVNIPEQSGTSYNWKVNIPAGSQVEILVEDSAGAEAWSGIVTVQNSTDSSCVDPKAAQALNAAVSSSTASSSGAAAAGAPTPSTTLDLPTVTGSAVSSAVSSAAAKTVAPAAASAGLANAASGDNTPPSSGSIPRAALPAGTLLATAAFLIALAHF